MDSRIIERLNRLGREIRVGFTGGRKAIQSERITLEIVRILYSLDYGISKVSHGGAVGADKIVHDTVLRILPSTQVEIWPSNLTQYHAKLVVNENVTVHDQKDPLERNKLIVDNSDLLVAIPDCKTEVLRSGTWQTIRYAKKTGVLVMII